MKIWTSRGENLLKYEYSLLAGPVCGIAWSPDSKRLAVCGGDKGAEAVCVAFDTGARLGECNTGHAKRITTIAYRPKSPFRIMTGSEDSHVCFHEGPPFRFLCSQQSVHSSFVNTVQFAPDGSVGYSCASDGLVAVYNGESGDLLTVLDPKLSCSIWGLTVLNAEAFAIVCGDKRIRFCTYTANGRICVDETLSTLVGRGDLKDMPLGICGTGPCLVVSLDGVVRQYTNRGVLETTWAGSQGPITSIVHAPKHGTFVLCLDGSVFSLECQPSIVVCKLAIRGTAGLVMNESTGHLMGLSENSLVDIISGETIVALPPTTNRLFGDYPNGAAQNGSGVVFFDSAKPPITQRVVCFSQKNQNFAYVYETERTKNISLQTEKRTFVCSSGGCVETEITRADIVAVAVWGNNVAVASASQELHVYTSGALLKGTAIAWTYHKARISCMQFVTERWLVTGGLDKHVFVWDCDDPENGPVAQLKDLHREGVSAICAYLTPDDPKRIKIISGGTEGSVRVNFVNLP